MGRPATPRRSRTEKRRRRRERRALERQGDEPAAPPAPPPHPATTSRLPQGIAWNGLIGASMGILPMALITVTVLVEPPGVGIWFAVVPAAMTLAYVPAAWASVANTERRQSILRASVMGSLVVAFVASFFFGLLILIVMLPPTVLLWMASGGFKPRG